jgi:hypothetical protein
LPILDLLLLPIHQTFWSKLPRFLSAILLFWSILLYCLKYIVFEIWIISFCLICNNYGIKKFSGIKAQVLE